MWNNQGSTSYGGQGGGGGGFSDQMGQSSQAGGYYQSQQGNTSSFSSPATGGGNKGKRIQTLIPCTIAQILQATQQDEQFKIGAVEIYQVSLVGLIRKVEMAATNILYRLDDWTGPCIDVRQWINNEEDTPVDEQPQVHRENTYIRVIGNIRTFGGKRSIAPFKIKPISDMNEVTLHILDTVHTHMLLTKRKAAEAVGKFGANQFSTPSKGNAAPSSFAAAGSANGLNNVQSQVHQLITSCHDDQGVSVSHLSLSLKGIPQQKIRDALEFLSNEGHIYSTIDDDHYKSTDC